MTTELWTSVDHYFAGKILHGDEALEQALVANTAAGLPAIDVSPLQGKLLHLLVRMNRARRVLEVGTLGGYSAIWLASALPGDGQLVTLELEPHHAEVARLNVARAGLAARVDIRVGPALGSLDALIAAGGEPFDLVFIDADKPSNPDYFTRALALTHPGSVIVVDNVVRGGRVADAASTDAAVVGVRRLHDLIASEARVTATAIQTVGTKGHDGFTIALVTG